MDRIGVFYECRKYPKMMDYYFYFSLELGCVIGFCYSLVQNATYIIRKVLKE
jgi:hypothetical protein